MADTLEQVLADELGDVPVLRKHGQDAIADAIERVCRRVADATEDYRKFLSESDAMLRSGKTRTWLRAHFGQWAHNDLARWSPHNSRAREYRAMIVPQRTDLVALRADAKRAARGEEVA
jgi:hypothetical protein